MSAKSLLIFLLVFVAGVSFWLFQVDKGLRNAREIITEQRTEPAPKRTVMATPNPEAVTKETLRAQLQTESQNLLNQIEIEKRKLETQKEAISKLRAPASEPDAVAGTTTNYSSAIRANREEITDFLNELRGYDQLEASINRRARALVQDQTSSARVLQEQLDNNIKTQQELISQTQDEITALQDYRNYVDARDVRMEEKQALLQSQKEQLDGLRGQRLQIAAEILEGTRYVQSEAEDALSGLNENKNSLNEQISNLRSEITRLQEQQNSSRVSTLSRTSLLSQYERSLEQQNRKVEALEQTLKTKEDQLDVLR